MGIKKKPTNTSTISTVSSISHGIGAVKLEPAETALAINALQEGHLSMIGCDTLISKISLILNKHCIFCI